MRILENYIVIFIGICFLFIIGLMLKLFIKVNYKIYIN